MTLSPRRPYRIPALGPDDTQAIPPLNLPPRESIDVAMERAMYARVARELADEAKAALPPPHHYMSDRRFWALCGGGVVVTVPPLFELAWLAAFGHWWWPF